MRTTISLLALVAALAAPALAQSTPPPQPTTTGTRVSTVSASQFPDGTYTGTVQKVLDSKTIVIKFTNGTQQTLTTVKPNVDFSKVQANTQIKFSLIKGQVAVFAPVTP